MPFAESIRPLFERETGLDLFQSKYGDGWWRSVRGEAEFGKIQEWIEAQGTRIFLRSCLDLSIALDYNIADVGIGQYTDIGELEHRAKTNNDSNAVDLLSSLCIETIRSSAFYAEAAFVSAVPAMSEKEFDVPSQISGRVAAALCRQDLTAEFKCKNPKELPLKDARMEEKWALLEKTGLFLGVKLPDKSKVILIDDKYQSGTTMQFVAMKLQEAGAKQIFGISLVKTLRDTDNAS